MSKVAVVFWSATGNTETMANCVAEGANGTIVPCSEMNAASWVQIWLHGKQEKLLLTNRDSCDKR